MDVIYMSYVVFAVIESKKQKKLKILVTLPNVTLGKEPLPSAFCPDTRQSCQKMRYQVSLPSASTLALGKAVYTTMCFPALPSARTLALGKEFSKKKYFFFAECRVRKALGKGFFQKKNFFAKCRVRKALGKEFSKKREKLCRVPS